jgi:hypothetical protein
VVVMVVVVVMMMRVKRRQRRVPFFPGEEGQTERSAEAAGVRAFSVL